MTNKLRLTLGIALLGAVMLLTLSGCGAVENIESEAEQTSAATYPPDPVVEPQNGDAEEQLRQDMQPPQKAGYLNYTFAYSITGITQGDRLAEMAAEECEESFSRETGTANVAEVMEQWIYQDVSPNEYSCGAVFLTWSADLCGLIDCGTFLRSTDLRETFDHLTKVNGFASEPLTKSTQFGGTDYNMQIGDLLFWTDDNGDDINAGIVTLAQGSRITVAVCSAENRVASFVLESIQTDTNVVKNCTVVRVIYPCNEQLVFLYLVNELGYTNAAACGALANIYCESMFEPNIVESIFSEGYGICQWTGSRRAALEMWCAAGGLDHSKLSNQLAFMKYELEEDVAGDLDWILRSMGDTEKDAYNAGVRFCEMYENPGEDEAKQRGELAKTFYACYSGHPYM